MKTKLTILALFFASIFFISLNSHSDSKSSSQAPIGRTGAPGETTCASCHSGGSYTGDIIFNLGDENTTEYIPGQTYPISFTSDFNALRFGFSVTALNENNEPAGEFTLVNNDNTSFATAGNGRQYVGHKNADNNNEWEFEWTAPASDQGDITFYYVINAANNDNATSGDYIETGTSTFSPGEAPETFDVVFNVDMTQLSEHFNPELDVVYITGELLNWAEPGDEPELQTMTRIDDSFIFTQTLQLEEGEYQYKYFLNEGWTGGEWEGDPNRVIIVTQDASIDDVWGYTSQEFGIALSLLVNPEDAGTVTGEGLFLANAIAQVSATPNETFVFLNWTNEDEEVVSTNAQYEFNMPVSDLTLTANFGIENFVLESEKSKLEIFPNPAMEYFIIRSACIIKDVSVFDISGKIIYNQSHSSYEVRVHNQWDTGVYMVRITTAEGVFIKKVQVK